MALGFVASVLLARALGAADFGVYGVLGAMAAVLLVVTDMGLGTTAAQRVGAVWSEDKGWRDSVGNCFSGCAYCW
ncbi:MAG: oligosaccharide flippase family protein [Anaerolineae bacterium]|nr:oligosaccharide flippase family protein [Anaerolineae bacterium]